MIARSFLGFSVVLATHTLSAQQTPALQPTGGAPIYHITVVQRTTKAINYRYRSEPTMIDFAGTVIMPKAKGNALVTSKQGRTEIEANFEHLSPPTPLGREFLTYVLWALTPDGRPHNLGEVIANSRDHASLRVSTDLQAFALIVTAEPYSSVRAPGDVVVLENQVRPDTVGMTEQVNARYELLPRGHYTLNLSNSTENRPPESARVSTREYEVLLEIYQAQNAVNIARTAGAGTFAPEVLARAEGMLNEARTRHEHKGDRTMILQQAREATQTAEDARLVAVERARQDSAAKLKAEVSMHRQSQAIAEDEAARARVERQAMEAELQRTQARLQDMQSRANAQLEAERAARIRAEADVAALQQQQAAGAQVNAADLARKRQVADQRAFRVRVYESLNATLPALDTPRGLVVILTDSSFRGARLQAEVSARARRLGATLASYRGLNITVEGYSDSSATETEAAERAEDIAALLRSNGLNVIARGMGARRPMGPSRIENARVEIVISGDALGSTASWDKPYSLSLQRESEASRRH